MTYLIAALILIIFGWSMGIAGFYLGTKYAVMLYYNIKNDNPPLDKMGEEIELPERTGEIPPDLS